MADSASHPFRSDSTPYNSPAEAGARGLVPSRDAKTVAPIDPAAVFHYRETVEQAITPNDYPRLTSLVRTLAPDTGSVRQLGDGLLWEQDSGYSALSLTINPEPAGTVIRADLRMDGRMFMYYLGAGIVSVLTGLVATTVLPILPGLAVGVAALVPSVLVARRLRTRSARRSREQLRALVQRLAAGIRGELE